MPVATLPIVGLCKNTFAKNTAKRINNKTIKNAIMMRVKKYLRIGIHLMEKFLKILWSLFVDYSRDADKRAIKQHNDYVEGLYDGAAASGQMSFSQAEDWKEYSKL